MRITTIIVTLLSVLTVFIGNRFLMLNPKDSIVDYRQYLGNRGNPAEIYATPSDGLVYSPMNIEVLPMDALMLIDIADDPEYACIEMQTFDDARGRGARVLLYHHDGPADSYYTSKAFEIKESLHDESFIDPDMQYHLAVTCSGLKASLRIRDKNEKPVEFKIEETLRRKWSKGFLAPIGASDAITFQYFPFYHMKDMNFVRRSGSEITVRIDGETRTPKKLPIPVDLELAYFSRYTSAPIIACWNRPHRGGLRPLRPKGRTAYQGEKTVYKLVENDGHYEIRRMLAFNERHRVSIDFSPPIPDLVSLRSSTVLTGRFCANADGVLGIVAGTYHVRRQGNGIDMEIRPQGGWQPIPGPSWVRTWIWKSAINVGSNHTVSMKSGWVREK